MQLLIAQDQEVGKPPRDGLAHNLNDYCGNRKGRLTMWLTLAFILGIVSSVVTWIANLKIDASVTDETVGLWILIVGWAPFLALLAIRIT